VTGKIDMLFAESLLEWVPKMWLKDRRSWVVFARLKRTVGQKELVYSLFLTL
jgi:hypothetical protein